MTPNSLSLIDISWEPLEGWLMLLPSRLPDKTEGGIYLPESYTKKSNRGVCVKVASDTWRHFLGLELFFPLNVEYVVEDAELNLEFYIIQAEHIILQRQPSGETKFMRISGEKDGEGRFIGIATLQLPKKN